MAEKVTFTHCSFCEAQCGLKVVSDGRDVLSIDPDRDNHNWRDYCIKGARADMTRTHPSRILHPMKRVDGRYVAVSYEMAIDQIAQELCKLRDQFGPDAIGDYAGNPAGFNVSNLSFHAGFFAALGTKNHFAVGSVDQNAFHYVAELMYGSAWFGLQTNIDKTDFILLFGSNPAVSAMSWMGGSANGWQRVKAMVARGGELVLVDPRRTESAGVATQHIAPLPEQDWALLLLILKTIVDEGMQDVASCENANGFADLCEILKLCGYDEFASRCDLSVDIARDLALRFARAENAACITRTGPSQGQNGALTEWLGHVLNVVTGRLDKAGGRFYNNSVVDVAAFAKEMMPAADTPSRVRGIQSVAGSRMLAELADEIETPGTGQIRGMFINSGNPVLSGPNGKRLDRALSTLDLLVSVDLFQRESHRHAHWLIPGTHFLERSAIILLSAGYRTEGFVQTSRAAVPPPPGVIPEWQFFRDLARAMHLPLFPNLEDPTPDVLMRGMLSSSAVRVTFEEIQAAQHGLLVDLPDIPATQSVVHTPDRRIHIAPAPLLTALRNRLAEPTRRKSRGEWPYQIISKRSLPMMNSFLGETVAADMRDKPGDTIEICRADAARDAISNGDLVTVLSACGALNARAVVSEDVRRGVAVMAHGWGTRLFDPAKGAVRSAEGVNRNELVSEQETDPLTGVPRLNGTPVRIARRGPSAQVVTTP